MFSSTEKHIALISCHGDPAAEIGKEEAGGQNVYVRHVGEELAKQGWKVDMFTRHADANLPTIVQHRENCRTIRLTAGPQEFVPRDELAEHVPAFVQSLLKFQRQSGVQYRVVHTNYWISAWIGMELKKLQPLSQVHTYHSLGAVKYQSVSTIPMIATTRLDVEKTVLKTAERIVATSPQEQEHMRSLMSTQGNIDIIPCGTNVDHFGSVSREAARQKLGIASDEQVVLYVGRFDPRKGIETLVRAIGQSQLRNSDKLRLMIGGGSRPGQSDGLERERIESIVGDLGLAGLTQFPGRLSPEELPIYYAAADVCVVPSHYEPFGLVAIEAMACGIPVIASDVGGLQFTVVPEKTGLLAPPKDEAAFAAAIDRILMNPDWSHQLGQAAQERVRSKFSWAGVATQLSDLYLELLAQQSKPVDQVSA
ncbi:glycosyltransferase family 1 protein [Leptolyngbya sp. FACHB-36]|uniref:glycosyltransferase family 4 protein n=1 Tax=Leptolyngbya sp. FACHB-36 TaxID=2692808 RepID=UPI0016809924|nr:glycosyltransferase family 1 protein [Leptolyngbya sp. FACHB-36]MBD2021032.1 glycosyltransferase family 1 protein [Leptolyngbya sp. FACHB-36]